MISFASATGNLMNRWGKCGLLLSSMRTQQLAQLQNMTNTSTGAVAQFDNESDIQALIGGSYIGALTGPESVAGIASQVAQATANRMVFRDNPQIGQTLTQGNVAISINEIIRQMKIAGATVLAMTVTAVPGDFIGTGNGVAVCSVRRPFDGVVMENSFAESVLYRCTQDSYSGGATAGNEGFQITGDGSQDDFFAFNWPLGSNALQEIFAINGDANLSQGNVLNNSGFADWAGNVPDHFTLVTGTAGTDILEESSIIYTGGASLHFVGDGVTEVELKQQFASAAGSLVTLNPQQQFSVTVFARGGASPASAGVLEIALVDENDDIINDAGSPGIPNSFTIDLTALNTVFTPFTGVFRTPVITPDEMYLRIKQTTPLSGGDSVYLDKLGMGLMTQLYTSGPFFSSHSGSIPFVANDQCTVPVTNSRGALGTLDTFQTLLARILNPFVMQNGFVFPSSSVPSIPDSLIG